MLETGWQPKTVQALRISMKGMNIGFPNAVYACVALTGMFLIYLQRTTSRLT